MSDDSFAELAKLKHRLESLGVKIKGGIPESVPFAELTNEQVGNDDVNRLLARCNRVEAALHSGPATIQDDGISVSEAFPSAPSELNQPSESPAPSSDFIIHPPQSPRKGPRKSARPPLATARKAQAQQQAQRQRCSPLSNLLADYKEAEARWNHEKADLRRQLAAEKKRCSKVECSLNKLSNLYESRLVDVKALKSALANRDDQLKAAVNRTHDQQESHDRATEHAAHELATITRERDDLKALLVATLARLETVDNVVRRADMSNAVMEERVGALEHERDKAVHAATSAQSRVESLLKSQRRIEWQNKMLDRISEVQIAHNRKKTAAMQDLLENGAADHASTVADTYTNTMTG